MFSVELIIPRQEVDILNCCILFFAVRSENLYQYPKAERSFHAVTSVLNLFHLTVTYVNMDLIPV